MANHTPLEKEKKITPLALALLLIVLLSGLVHYFFKAVYPLTLFNIYLHSLAGVLAGIAATLYALVHIKRTAGSRKPLLAFSGFVILLLLAAMLVSGALLCLSLRESTRNALLYLHLASAAIAILLTLVHLGQHYLKNRGKSGSGKTFIVLHKKNTLRLLGGTALILAVPGVLHVLLNETKEQTPPAYPLHANYEYPYGDHPFLPGQSETSNRDFIQQQAIAGSARCESCHTEIAQQWRESAHRMAAADPVYVNSVDFLVDQKGVAAARYCEGCHTPIALFTGRMTKGGHLDGARDAVAMDEGVSCLACHRITQIKHLNGVGSYHYSAPSAYVVPSENSLLGAAINQSIRMAPAGHKQEMLPAAVTTPQFCATCHAQFMDKSMNDWGWVKMQDEYAAWLASPYSGAENKAHATATATDCQDCHMPKVPANDPAADANGLVKSHRFIGANTMIPSITGFKDQLNATVKFLSEDKIRVAINPPRSPNTPHSTLSVEERLRKHGETPPLVYLGTDIELSVVVTNQGVGHDFPGGTTDINEAWIHFVATDAAGRVVFESGQLLADGSVDPNAVFYRSHPVDRHGKEVWKHDLFHMVGDSYKNVIRAGDADFADYRFSVPMWAKGPLVLSATVNYRKLNNKYARWALKNLYRDLPIVAMANQAITVDVLEQPAAQARFSPARH